MCLKKIISECCKVKWILNVFTMSLSTPKDHTGWTESEQRKEWIYFWKALCIEDKKRFQQLKIFTSNISPTAKAKIKEL